MACRIDSVLCFLARTKKIKGFSFFLSYPYEGKIMDSFGVDDNVLVVWELD